MLAHSDLQRSIQRMAFSFARQIEKKSAETAYAGLAEREIQYQYDISGTLGSLPAETSIEIPFDVVFIADPGTARDSSLDRPQVRFGSELALAPAGTHLYGHVSEWIVDVDLNFTGAKVTVGVYSPNLAASLGGVLSPVGALDGTFQASVHFGFQGFCAIDDPDSAYNTGGNTTIDGGQG